ncbi:MAG: protein kinase [Pirellulales bacterium]
MNPPDLAPPNRLPCPPAEQLANYSLGKLSWGELEWVEQHIEQCDSCQQTLDRLQVGDDTFVRQMRPPKSSTDPASEDSHQSESALRDAMEKALRNAPPSLSAAQPVAAPPAIVPPPPAPSASPAISPPAASAATSSPDANRGAFQPPRTVEEFSRLLSESRVLSAQAIQAFLHSFPTEQQPVDAQSAASLFVQAGQLTPFQVRAIFQGKHTGLMIEDHEVLDLLGRGGMGSVFKARNRRLDRIEAIKVISGKKLGTVEARQRFDREARAAARISHPNVVATYDAGEFNGISYLTMQFVDGLDLAKTVRSRGPLPVDHAVAYILQAAAGLQAAHEAGIIHRDIKPHNLLLDRQGKVRILDMGLARLSDAANMAAQEGLTQSGQMMGTIDYMSPEQTIDVRKVTAASDVYSLGCTLYFLLTGKPPFQAETMGAKLMAHHHQPPPRLIDARADIPTALEAVFQKMLAKDPAARYASMDELIVALQAYSQVEPPPPPASLAGANAPAAGVSEEIDPSMASFFAQLSAPGGKKPKAAFAPPKDVKSTKEPQLLFGPASSSPATVAPSATPVKRPATAKSESSRRDPIKLLFIATAAGLVATILFVLGIFLTVRTPEGEVVVTLNEGVSPKDVTIVLRNDGKVFQVTMKDNFRLRLREGQYQVSLSSPNLQYSVNASRATIAKDQRTVLTVELVPPSPIPREARYYGGRYYLFIPDPLSRNDARQRCLSLRGRLASIDSANRNSFVAKLAEYQEAWIGHRLVGGRWMNEQDKPIGYSNWYTGEPSGGSNESYVLINWVSPGKWNDHSDSQPGELKGFICEWNPNDLAENSLVQRDDSRNDRPTQGQAGSSTSPPSIPSTPTLPSVPIVRRKIGLITVVPTVSTQVAPSEGGLSTDAWYDLLREVDVSEHAINGEWTRDGSAVVPKAGNYNRLIVPFVVEGDYDLRFAITPTVQNSPLGLFLPLNGATLAETMFGGGSNRSALPVPNSPGQQTDVPSQLIQNREQAFEVQVRGANESEVSIVVLKDGTPYLNWKGPRQQVSIPTFSTLPQPNLLGFTIWSDPVRVSHYRFRLVSGKATRWNPSIVNVDATPNSTTPTIEGYGGKRYKLSDKPVTFGEALRIARNWSGRLVTISSAQEAAWIKQTFGDKAIWLSAFRRGRSGREWVDERLRPLSYYGGWGENQPEGQDWQYSLRLAEGSHEWHDAKSDDVAHALLEWGDETASASPSVPPSYPTTDLTESVSQAKRALQTGDWARYYTADAPSTSRKDALAAALVNHAAKSNTEKIEALAACELALEASKAGRDPWLAYEARRVALTRFPQLADDWNKRILERLALARDPNEAWLGAQVLQRLAGELLEAGQKKSLLELFPRLETIARSKPLKDEIKRLRARVEGLIELMPPNPAEDAVGMQEWRGFAAALTRDDWNQALREFSTSAKSPFAAPARTLSTLDRYRGSPAVSLTIANLFRDKLAKVGKPETKSLLSAAERFWLENAALQSGATVEPQVAERLKPTFPNVKWPLVPLDGAWNEPALRPKAAFTGLIVPEDGNFARFNGNGEVRYEAAPTSSYVHEFAVTLRGNQGSMTFNYGGHEGNVIVLFWKREENRFQWEHQHYRGGGFSWLGHGEFRSGERLEFTVYAHEGIHLSKLKSGRDAGAQYPADSLEFSIRTNDNAQGVIHYCRFREWNALDARLLNRKLPEFELHSGSVGLEARQLHARNLDLENHPAINNPTAFCVTASGTPMLPVPAGSHLRPGTDNFPNSLIRITKPYWLGRHEVTQAEWVRVMGTNPSRRRGSPYLPVENVNIVDAAAFCGELTKLERSRLPSGYVYRLPTEAEWERACLAPNNPAQPADVQLPNADESWNNDNSQDHPWSVGQRRANAWGFHDMVGNVAEMTADAWNDRPANNAPRFTDPYAPITKDSTIFIARGGAYWWNPSDLSPFTRRNHPAAGACWRGFRIALAPALSP